MQFNNKSVKSKTVSNNQNPVWQFSSQFHVGKDDESKLLFQVYDDDIGKDDFLGECCVDIKDIMDNGVIQKEQSYKLEKCKTGEIILSIKFVPKQNIYKKLGDLSLIIHSANNLEKKNKLKKADPYVVVRLGELKSKSSTINNTSNPVWEHKTQFEVGATSPDVVSVQVFDDDIGKDGQIGTITLDITELMQRNQIESKVKLENSKSGELVFSAFFVQTDDDQEKMNERLRTKLTQVHQPSNIVIIDPVFIGHNFLIVPSNFTGSKWFLV